MWKDDDCMDFGRIIVEMLKYGYIGWKDGWKVLKQKK